MLPLCLQASLQRDINGLTDPDRSTRRRSVRQAACLCRLCQEMHLTHSAATSGLQHSIKTFCTPAFNLETSLCNAACRLRSCTPRCWGHPVAQRPRPCRQCWRARCSSRSSACWPTRQKSAASWQPACCLRRCRDCWRRLRFCPRCCLRWQSAWVACPLRRRLRRCGWRWQSYSLGLCWARCLTAQRRQGMQRHRAC